MARYDNIDGAGQNPYRAPMRTVEPRLMVELLISAGWQYVDHMETANGPFTRLTYPDVGVEAYVPLDVTHPRFAELTALLHADLTLWRQLGASIALVEARMTASTDVYHQATMIRLMTLYRSGLSLRKIGTVLSQEGHHPKRAATWHPQVLKVMIDRIKQAGEYR